ncbi:MAG: hypothetical protein R2683_02695 [Bifidobacterium adolescentis]
MAGICRTVRGDGIAIAEVSVGIRSGDTTPQERRRIVSHPPGYPRNHARIAVPAAHLKARRILSAVDTVIVDEVHAIAGSNVARTLALSLERLEALPAGLSNASGFPPLWNASKKPKPHVSAGTQPVRVIRPNRTPTWI